MGKYLDESGLARLWQKVKARIASDMAGKQNKKTKIEQSGSITRTLADNTEYIFSNVSSLAMTYPAGDFSCWISFTVRSGGTATVSFPSGTTYIGDVPSTFEAGKRMTNSFFGDSLTVVQGDVFSPIVKIENETGMEIAKVYFSSHALGITKELTPSGMDYTMRLSGEVTKDFPIGEATYDITVAFSDGSRYTARYAGKLTVREKINEVVPDE